MLNYGSILAKNLLLKSESVCFALCRASINFTLHSVDVANGRRLWQLSPAKKWQCLAAGRTTSQRSLESGRILVASFEGRMDTLGKACGR